jgi:hypothetical protein
MSGTVYVAGPVDSSAAVAVTVSFTILLHLRVAGEPRARLTARSFADGTEKELFRLTYSGVTRQNVVDCQRKKGVDNRTGIIERP